MKHRAIISSAAQEVHTSGVDPEPSWRGCDRSGFVLGNPGFVLDNPGSQS